VLTDRGLGPASASIADRSPVPVDIVEVPADRPPRATETTAYFTVSEALTNVAKYAQATRATVRIATEDGSLVVEVRDDGIGGARAGTGSGLSGLSDRVGAIDGTLSVDSPPGEGTLVRAILPLQVVGEA
jgi:signal transduction histidine kinase